MRAELPRPARLLAQTCCGSSTDTPAGCNNQAQASSQAVQEKFASAAASANASVSAANGDAQATAQVQLAACLASIGGCCALLAYVLFSDGAAVRGVTLSVSHLLSLLRA